MQAARNAIIWYLNIREENIDVDRGYRAAAGNVKYS